MSRWTAQEENQLRELYTAGVDVAEIAERIGRPFEAIRTRVRTLGLSRTPVDRWRDDEIATLRADYDAGVHPREIAEKLGRPVGGVFNKAHQLGLKTLNRRPWTAEEDAAIRAGHAAGRPLADIARELGRKYTTVAKHASVALGLSFTRAPRKPRGKPAAPASAPTVANPTPVCCRQQTAQVGASAADLRLACLRIAAKFRDETEETISLAQEIDRWAGRKDREARLQALEIAASRHAQIATAYREANMFATWAGDRNRGPRMRGLDLLEELVAGITGVAGQLLRSESRIPRYVRARRLFCYVAHHLAGASYGEIGQHLGNRDRTTITHAMRVVESQRGDKETEDRLAAIAEGYGGELPPAPAREDAEDEPDTAPAAESKPEPEPEPEVESENDAGIYGVERIEPPDASGNVKVVLKDQDKPGPAPKPVAKKRPRRRKPIPRKAAPAEPAPLADGEKKVLRTIIRTGKGKVDPLAEATGVPVAPLTKMLNSLQRKGYIEIRDGTTKALRLPDGRPMPAAPAGAVTADLPVIQYRPAPEPRPRREIEIPTPPEEPVKRASRDEPARRRCLGCGADFKSSGFGNRMCPKCQNRPVAGDWMGGDAL